MSPLVSWLFVLTVVVAIPVCAVHIAMLLDDRHGWIKRHEKWMCPQSPSTTSPTPALQNVTCGATGPARKPQHERHATTDRTPHDHETCRS